MLCGGNPVTTGLRGASLSHTAKNKPWRIKTAVALIDRNRAVDFDRYIKSASRLTFAKTISFIKLWLWIP